MLLKPVATLCIVFALFISAGCGNDTAGPDTSTGPWKETTSSFNVTEWQPNTVYFDSTSMSGVIEADTVQQRFVFKASDSKANTLAPGKILFIHGLALRKVTTVTNQGNTIVVLTERATLNEAIKNGTIEWDKSIDFSSPVLPVVVGQKGEEIPMSAVRRDSFQIKVKFGEYEYTIFMKMRGDNAYVKMDIEKTIGQAVKGRFTCEGTLNRFRSKAKMVFINGKAVEVGFTNEQLRGDMTLSIAVAGSGEEALAGFVFPIVLLKYPFLVGPIPTVLNVKTLFVIQGLVPPEGSSLISVKFGFNSNTGFSYAGNSLSPNGKMGTATVTKNQAQTGAAGPVGINYGLAFPRIEISMLNESVVPWMQTAFLIGGYYQPGIKACQLGLAEYIGSAGVDLSFLGLAEIAKPSYNLWDKIDTVLKAGNCE